MSQNQNPESRGGRSVINIDANNLEPSGTVNNYNGTAALALPSVGVDNTVIKSTPLPNLKFQKNVIIRRFGRKLNHFEVRGFMAVVLEVVASSILLKRFNHNAYLLKKL